MDFLQSQGADVVIDLANTSKDRPLNILIKQQVPKGEANLLDVSQSSSELGVAHARLVIGCSSSVPSQVGLYGEVIPHQDGRAQTMLPLWQPTARMSRTWISGFNQHLISFNGKLHLQTRIRSYRHCRSPTGDCF